MLQTDTDLSNLPHQGLPRNPLTIIEKETAIYTPVTLCHLKKALPLMGATAGNQTTEVRARLAASHRREFHSLPHKARCLCTRHLHHAVQQWITMQAAMRGAC